MRKVGTSQLFGAIAVLASAVALPALGQEAVKPWNENVVPYHVDQQEIAGALTREQLDNLIDEGERLFVGKYTAADGAGRPFATQAIIPTKRKHPVRSAFQRVSGPDANSCASCHNDPIIGGAGDLAANVFVSEGFTNADFDTIDPQFSNERNSNHLMGAGLIELLAREMTAELAAIRTGALKKAAESGEAVTVALVTKGIDFGKLRAEPDGLVNLEGIEGLDSDLIIRPFSQKGVFASLRQFTVNALNHHHGIQAIERFGVRWTGEDDHDGDGKPNELLDGDISALVAWQASLKAPIKKVPESDEWRLAAEQGERLFADIGCASCHVPALPLESTVFRDPGPVDGAGTLRSGELARGTSYDLNMFEWVQALPRDEQDRIMVPLYGDLKRHRISDQQISALGNELLAQRFVERDQFQTSELWGIASTAPYGHRGDLTTLDEVIRAHGGDARQARDTYVDLVERDRDALLAFLKTLVIE